MRNEAKCMPGDVVKVFGRTLTIKEVISSYLDTVDGKQTVQVEFYATDGQYYYYKQNFDGGEYIRKEKKLLDSWGVDCSDIFRKYGYTV